MEFVINANTTRAIPMLWRMHTILHDVTCESQQISEMTLVALRRLLQINYALQHVVLGT